MNRTYVNAKLHMLVMGILIIGAVNWGAYALGYNMVEHLSIWLNSLFSSNISFDKYVYIIVAICGIMLAFNRSTWLPFLGESVFPQSLVSLKQPNSTDTSVVVMVRPNTKVVYWASKPGDGKNVEEAYDDFSNSGVVMSNDKGEAVLNIITSGNYIVPSGRKIERHIHYREMGLPYGMIGEIKTAFY